MKKSLVGAIASVAGFVLLGGGLIAVSVASRPAPEPVGVVTFIDPGGYLEETTPTPTPTPTPTVEPVVEAAPAPEPPPAEEPAGPVLCPSGSTANSNDGVNDTSCFPDICFTISVPNPDHPECDYAFEP